ncbi:MAG: ribbon-helix-helix domain-containing protein [archaeon]|nr:ribbon-helix-helix domain-containing protein [archaeon]
MVDDGTKITIRVSNEDIQLMEDFMSDNGIENRSDFIRDAIRGYIANNRTPGEIVDENAILVHLSPVVLQTLENMSRDGTAYSAEDYIRQLVNADIIPRDALEDSKARSFKAAQQSFRDL